MLAPCVNRTSLVWPEMTLEGIRLAMSLFPAAIFILCVWCLSFYSIGKETEIQMTRQLALSRARTGGEKI